MFGALVIAFPVIATQIYKFVAPGLYKNERDGLPAVPDCVAAAVSSRRNALVYFFFTPMVMWFFLNMQQAPGVRARRRSRCCRRCRNISA